MKFKCLAYLLGKYQSLVKSTIVSINYIKSYLTFGICEKRQD
jgi:hypothetical protein